MPGIFVTGTGTDIGKTIVSAGITRVLRQAGLDAVPMKPCQTGCMPGAEDGLSSPDLDFALRVCGYAPETSERRMLSPFRFEPACSPHLAATLSGTAAPTVGAVVRAVRQVARRHEWVVAEGAGGLLVPINRRSTMLDVMQSLNWPVLLTAPAGLGTLNATLLSVECLRRRGLTVVGVVLNDARPGPRDAVARAILNDNPHTLERFGKVSVLGRVPWLAGLPESAAAWTRFAASFSPLIPEWAVFS